MPYSPFSKSLNELDASDLEALKDVNEGWYVEYKGEMSKAPDIAKSVSAFANTYGGWVFTGSRKNQRLSRSPDHFLVYPAPMSTPDYNAYGRQYPCWLIRLPILIPKLYGGRMN